MPASSTVYVVDDDRAAAASVEALMIAHGLDVEVFSSAEHFLAGFDTSRPGCLILDVRLPGMNGLDLQEAIASQGIELPIIFISGHADAELRTRAINNGAIDFLEKPFSGERLCETVHAVISEQELRHANEQDIA